MALRLPADLDFDQWEAMGARILDFADASHWWIGDWLAHGEWKYGDRYRAVLERLDREYGEVRHLAYVSGNVPETVRQPDLSWTHHRAVAKLVPKDQEEWLKRALEQGWSTRRLVEELQRALQLPAGGQEDEHQAIVLEQLRFTAPTERVQHWRDAAERVESSLEDWMAAVLDVAAAESEKA